MKNYKVNEIFTSIQGEGARVGRLAVFVRFSGCPRHCSFCDTRHDTWEDYDFQELILAIQAESKPFSGDLDCVLTGGEPLLQVDQKLLCALSDLGYTVCIETSGDWLISEQNSHFTSMISALKSECPDVTMSPKDSDYSVRILKRVSCLKVVCPLPFDESVLDGMVETLSRHGWCQADLVFQPITPPDGTNSWKWKAACKEALALAKHRKIHHNETWKVIPQNHVLMGFK